QGFSRSCAGLCGQRPHSGAIRPKAPRSRLNPEARDISPSLAQMAPCPCAAAGGEQDLAVVASLCDCVHEVARTAPTAAPPSLLQPGARLLLLGRSARGHAPVPALGQVTTVRRMGFNDMVR